MEADMQPVTRQFDAALRIIAELRGAGHEAYLAGGCVRDLLLGRAPHDYDVATSATPDVVLRLFPRTFAVGAHFGVVLVASSSEADATGATEAELAPSQADGNMAGNFMRANSEQLAPPHVDGNMAGDFMRANSEQLAPPQVVTEVATFRSDGAYSDGRHPHAVRYTVSAEEDVRRRDFTINGLLLDPDRLFPQGLKPALIAAFAAGLKSCPDTAQFQSNLSEQFQSNLSEQFQNNLRAAAIDHVGGLADLEAGIVRAIGQPGDRFEEDRLRMLRGVRFAARFGFEMEAGTAAAMHRLAPRIAAVSRERVRDELTRMLTEGAARRAFELLDETGLLAEVLPEIERMKGVEQPPQFHPEGDVWIHTLRLLEQLDAGCPLTLAWGALLHDVGKPPTFTRADRIRFNGHVEVGVAISAEICRRFRFSNDETRQILSLVGNHMRFADAGQMKTSTLKRFFRLENFPEHLALHRMDCLAGSGNLDHYRFVRQRYESMPEEAVRPAPLITGRELIAAGYKPGALFREMLRAVEDAQLEGTIATAEEALALLCDRFPLDGPPTD
jgi:poly(A) polymerase